MANTKKAPITGVKTEAQKAKALATAKGPKPGSARANQSVKLAGDSAADHIVGKISGVKATDTKIVAAEKAIAVAKSAGMSTKQMEAMLAKYRKANPEEAAAHDAAQKPSKLVTKPDVIKEVKGTTDGRYIAVKAGGDNALTYPVTMTGKAELAKLAAVGASFKALQNWLKTHKPEAKLATGLDSRSAPQSAMAAAESRTGEKGASAATGSATGSGSKAKATAKVSMKGDFTYAVGKANDTRADTWTHHMVTMIQSATDTAAARAKHDKSGRYVGKKLDFTWAKAKGFIK